MNYENMKSCNPPNIPSDDIISPIKPNTYRSHNSNYTSSIKQKYSKAEHNTVEGANCFSHLLTYHRNKHGLYTYNPLTEIKNPSHDQTNEYQDSNLKDKNENEHKAFKRILTIDHDCQIVSDSKAEFRNKYVLKSLRLSTKNTDGSIFPFNMKYKKTTMNNCVNINNTNENAAKDNKKHNNNTIDKIGEESNQSFITEVNTLFNNVTIQDNINNDNTSKPLHDNNNNNDDNEEYDPRINFVKINELNQKRPLTSYGGLFERQQSLQKSLRIKTNKLPNDSFLPYTPHLYP